MNTREEKEELTYKLKKVLAAIKRLSLEDFTEIHIMSNFGLDKLITRKYPFVALLGKCFFTITKNKKGAEKLMKSLSKRLPKDITLLADHDLTFKLNILLDITVGIVNYELTSLALAMAAARVELNGITDFDSDHELQQKKEKKFKDKIDEKSSKYKNLADFPFMFARERLEWFIVNIENLNSILQDLFDDENDLNEYNKYLLALFHKLDEIAKSPESEDKKLKKMEQAVVDLYLYARKKQGLCVDDDLANALENFLISPLGLNIPLKYGIDVPHHVTKQKIDIDDDATIGIEKPEDMLLLLTTKQEEGSFADKYKKLITQLSPEHLKTQRRAVINQLIRQIEEIKDEANIESLKRKIAETYVTVSNQARETFFSNNLATALQKFCKQEWNMEEKEILKCGTPQVGELRIMCDMK